MFALAILVMVLVLAALYENFADPFIILVTVPLAMLGAVGGLMLRGLPLDVYGQMGLLMLVSLTAKNAILIVEFANQRMAEGLDLTRRSAERRSPACGRSCSPPSPPLQEAYPYSSPMASAHAAG